MDMQPLIWPHTSVLLACIVLTSAAQLLLKFGSGQGSGWRQGLLNWRTLLGYGLLTLVAAAMVFALQRLELRFVTGVQSLIYVLVILGARVLLKEHLTPQRILGITLIVAGVATFNLGF